MPPLATWTAFDWFLAGLVALSALLAFRRGIVRVLFSLVGLVAGVVLAGWYYLPLAAWLGRWIESPPAARIAAFLLILFAVSVVVSLAGGFVRQGISTIGLGFADRLLGAAFGVLRGLLLGVAVLMALAAFLPGTPWMRGSRLAPGFLAGAHAISPFVPAHLSEKIAAGTRHLIQQTPERLSP